MVSSLFNPDGSIKIPKKSVKIKEKKAQWQQLTKIVKSAVTLKLIGGQNKHVHLMNRKHNSLDVPSVNTLGENIAKNIISFKSIQSF